MIAVSFADARLSAPRGGPARAEVRHAVQTRGAPRREFGRVSVREMREARGRS